MASADLAKLRRVLSSEGRLANFVLLLAALVTVGLGVLVAWFPTAQRVRLLIITFLVLSFIVAGRFATKFCRVFLLVGVGTVLVVLVHLGREETSETLLRDARADATALAYRLSVGDRPESPVTDTKSQAGAAIADLEKAVQSPVPSDPAQVSAAPLVAELRTVLTNGTAKRVLDEIRPRVTALPAGEVATKASAAVDAVAAAIAAPSPPKPSLDGVTANISALCKAAGGSHPSIPPPFACHERHDDEDKEDDDPHEGEDDGANHTDDVAPNLGSIGERRAKAELEVARYLLSIASTEEARKALAIEVDKGTVAYGDAARTLVTGVDEIDLLQAVQRGAHAVAPLPGTGGGASVALAVGLLGWLIAGVIAVLFYRRLEQRAAAGALGPVVVKGPDDKVTADDERFRRYLVRNIPDPGTVPGSTALQPITDLLAAFPASLSFVGKLVAPIINAVDQPRGYVVTYRKLEPDPAAKADEKPEAMVADAAKPSPAASPASGTKDVKDDKASDAAIVVRVNVARTGGLVATEIVDSKEPAEALREAAYWAAAVVIDRSDRVPRWAQWSPDTAASLASFYAKTDRLPSDLKLIEDAVRGAPTSGALCLTLSHEYALDDKHLHSFEFALRAAAIDQRFVAARYRLAVCSSLLASNLETNWLKPPVERRDRVAAALERYQGSDTAELRTALRDLAVGGATDGLSKATKKALCDFALKELTACDDYLRPTALLTNWLRRSERSYWAGFLRTDGDRRTKRKAFRDVIASARPAIRQRGGYAPDVTDVEKKLKVTDGRLSWTVAYNLACFHAIRPSEEQTSGGVRALELLELAVERPDSQQMKKSWITKDPDLKNLQSLDRFKLFLNDLIDDEGTDADKT